MSLTRLTGAAPLSLLANVNGKYVTAGNAGGSALIADATAIGPWQKFYRTPG